MDGIIEYKGDIMPPDEEKNMNTEEENEVTILTKDDWSHSGRAAL